MSYTLLTIFSVSQNNLITLLLFFPSVSKEFYGDPFI